MINVIKAICSPRNENEKEAMCNMIMHMNEKMQQNAEEKYEIMRGIVEHKKESAFDKTNESIRIVKTAKE